MIITDYSALSSSHQCERNVDPEVTFAEHLCYTGLIYHIFWILARIAKAFDFIIFPVYIKHQEPPHRGSLLFPPLHAGLFSAPFVFHQPSVVR